MTGNEAISGALKAIGVLQETESASAEQAADGLVRLNDLMADLSGDGVDVGYAPQSDPTLDVGLNIESRQAVKSLLAVVLCPDYERQPSPVLIALATAGREKLLRDAIIRNPITSPQTLPRGDGGRGVWIDGRWNIFTGT